MIWLDCNGPPEFEAWATVDFTKDGVITIVLRCKVKKNAGRAILSVMDV